MQRKVKLSDYVATFFEKIGVRHVFAVSGGASLHLIHSIAKTRGIDFVCPQHEQAGAMAADGYARMTNQVGVAIATSGPGATNLLTGACCSFYDSIPLVLITGQVSTHRMRGKLEVRQIGFQETSTIEMFSSITKYATTIVDPSMVRFELEKATSIATTGRMGPTLLDIPDNIQRELIVPEELVGYTNNEQNEFNKQDHSSDIEQMFLMLKEAQRPVAVFGWGLHLAGAEEKALEFVRKLSIPVAPTWAAADIMPSKDPLFAGTFGTHGTRYGNFTVQNSDLIISFGSRLDTKSTGSPITTFAREAKKIYIDIDKAEIEKFKSFDLDLDLGIHADVNDFLSQVLRKSFCTPKNKYANWISSISGWKKRYPICPQSYYEEDGVNPYCFFSELAKFSKDSDIYFVDTGCTVAWMMQTFSFKRDQRIFHDFNNTAMGWALPASIGACFANPNVSITSISGDGSLQMNIQELATVVRHNLPLKIIVLNNNSYSMIQQTQDQWLESDYLASSIEGGLAFPNFVKVAKAYGLQTLQIEKNLEIVDVLKTFYASKGPIFCNVVINADHRVIPQVKFGRPNEDSEPLLSRAEFRENMIVKPIKQ